MMQHAAPGSNGPRWRARTVVLWLALVVLSLVASGCSTGENEPDEASFDAATAVPSTPATSETPGDRGVDATAEPDTADPTAGVDGIDESGDATEPFPPFSSERFAAVTTVTVGDTIRDADGNTMVVHQVVRWPDRWADLEPFTRIEYTLPSGIEAEWGDVQTLIGLDVGFCAAGELGQGVSPALDLVVDVDIDVGVDSAAAQVLLGEHPVLDPPFSLPSAAACSRGWVPVAWNGPGERPGVVRHIIADGDEMALYQWVVRDGATGSVGDVDNTDADDASSGAPDVTDPADASADTTGSDAPAGTAAAGQTLRFTSGPLENASVTFVGWAELHRFSSPFPDTRLIGAFIEACPGRDGWPVVGFQADGWNLGTNVPVPAGAGIPVADLRGATCVEGWVAGAIPVGATPTGFWFSDRSDPSTGFGSFSFNGGALPLPD